MITNIYIYQQLNLKNKVNEKAEQKHTHKYRKHFDGCQIRGFRRISKKSQEIKKYKLVVVE